MKAGISELSAQIAASGARTIGEYFGGLNPHQQRIRNRMDRSQHVRTGVLICKLSSPTGKATARRGIQSADVRTSVFQRPIASQEHLIGFCELEPKERRASWASLEAQRFRVLQKVNDLAVIVPGRPDGEETTASETEEIYVLLDRRVTKHLLPFARSWGSSGRNSIWSAAAKRGCGAIARTH